MDANSSLCSALIAFASQATSCFSGELALGGNSFIREIRQDRVLHGLAERILLKLTLSLPDDGVCKSFLIPNAEAIVLRSDSGASLCKD